MQLQVSVYNDENKYGNKVISSFEEIKGNITNKEVINVSVGGTIVGVEISDLSGNVINNEKLKSSMVGGPWTQPQFQTGSLTFKGNMYHCDKCKLAVIVLPSGEVFKACKCEAPIIANMEATVFNVSKMKG